MRATFRTLYRGKNENSRTGDQPVSPACQSLAEGEKSRARACEARYNLSSVGFGLFAVTVWRDGRPATLAVLPITPRIDDWARAFCARQNQDPDPVREAKFVARAAVLAQRYTRRFGR